MKTYLIQINYGWSEYELEHCPYYSVMEVNANNKEDAISICNFECSNQYLGGQLNIPMYWKVLRIGIKGKTTATEGWKEVRGK